MMPPFTQKCFEVYKRETDNAGNSMNTELLSELLSEGTDLESATGRPLALFAAVLRFLACEVAPRVRYCFVTAPLGL
jgi:hypothetical protein